MVLRNPKKLLGEEMILNWRYIAPAQRENHILASYSDDSEFWIGPNDADLMNRLRNAGTDTVSSCGSYRLSGYHCSAVIGGRSSRHIVPGKRFGDDEA